MMTMMMTTGHTHFYTEIKQFIRARLPSWRGEGGSPPATFVIRLLNI